MITSHHFDRRFWPFRSRAQQSIRRLLDDGVADVGVVKQIAHDNDPLYVLAKQVDKMIELERLALAAPR